MAQKSIANFFARTDKSGVTTAPVVKAAALAKKPAQPTAPSVETTTNADAPASVKKRRIQIDDDADEDADKEELICATMTTADESSTTASKMEVDHELATESVIAESRATDDNDCESSTVKYPPPTPASPAKITPASPSKEKKTFGMKRPESSDMSKKGCSDLDYHPEADKYHPINSACWQHGQAVPYVALAATFEAIEGISKRLKIIEILSNFFRSVIVLSPNDLLPCVYLCANSLAPAYEGVELGIGDAVLVKAIAESTGRTVAKIKADATEKGDLGLVAKESRSNQRTMFTSAILTVAKVFKTLREIAAMSGNSAQQKKIEKIKSLLVACRGAEPCYVIRSLSGKLRIGLAEQSMLMALGRAAALTPPNQSYPPEILDASRGCSSEELAAMIERGVAAIKTAFCELPNFDKIIPILLSRGLDALKEECILTPGIPLKPMLAHPTKGISEVLTRFENLAFTCEYKYDGERAQVHYVNGDIRIFSRNSEDLTKKYPDIVSRLPNIIGAGVTSFILDCESVAWDREKEQILPFQVLSTRKRKETTEEEVKIQVCLFAFDLLSLNGKPYIREPLKARREALYSNFTPKVGEFMFAKSMDGTQTEEIAEFLEESIKGNCEGLMVKTLEEEATYGISKRSRSWLKVKKDYLDGVGDTLDLVVIGGYKGTGKRTGVYGGFLLACYDAENEEFQSICKIGTGFSDEALSNFAAYFKAQVIPAPKSYYRFDDGVKVDEWFEASQVWEVKAADLSISPLHKAGMGLVHSEKGISLRFPRFLRIRDDKKPEEATDATQVAEMYRAQEINHAEGTKQEEEDFY